MEAYSFLSPQIGCESVSFTNVKLSPVSFSQKQSTSSALPVNLVFCAFLAFFSQKIDPMKVHSCCTHVESKRA